jgi:hypothetical protein
MNHETIEKMPIVQPKLSGFIKGFVITDLVFSSIKVILALFGIVGLFAIGTTNTLFVPGIAEVTTNALIAFFGITGNILVLRLKKTGIVFCWLNVAFSVLNMLTGVWQIFLGEYPDGSAGFVFLGAAATLLVRITFLVFYSIAIKKASDSL